MKSQAARQLAGLAAAAFVLGAAALMAPAFAELYDRYLPKWEEHLADGDDKDFWRGVVDIPDEEIWSTHQRLKARLIAFVHDRVRRQRTRLGESPENIRNAVLPWWRPP